LLRAVKKWLGEERSGLVRRKFSEVQDEKMLGNRGGGREAGYDERGE